MHKILILLVMLCSCAVIGTKHSSEMSPNETKMVAEACSDYCKSPYEILYRNKKTSFCECYTKDKKFVKSVIIGKYGTIYK